MTARTAEAIPEPAPRLIDPVEDSNNVWVMLDEGCNQTARLGDSIPPLFWRDMGSAS